MACGASQRTCHGGIVAAGGARSGVVAVSYKVDCEMPKVVVIGIDCMTPQLLFDKWLDDLPTFKRLCEAGTWGRLKSVNPPITVPAWSCMMSGYKPAQLGLYGFRHRVIGTYDDLYFATSKYVNKPRAWQLINDAGYTAAILGVPQTFPMKKVKGIAVSSGSA